MFFNLEDLDISISQEAMDESSTKYEYTGSCQLVQSGENTVVMDCSLADVGGESFPNVTLEIFLASGNAKVTGNLGPEFEIINPSLQGVDNALSVECFSIYDASNNPEFLMLSKPHFAGAKISDVQFMTPIALTTSSKGVIYPLLVDSIQADVKTLSNHPGLSRGQLSSGRSDQFYEVQREVDEIQEDLEVLLEYAAQEILPIKVSWSSLNQFSEELTDVSAKLEDLDMKLTEKEAAAREKAEEKEKERIYEFRRRAIGEYVDRTGTESVRINRDNQWFYYNAYNGLVLSGIWEDETGKLFCNEFFDYVGKIAVYRDGTASFTIDGIHFEKDSY